MPDPYWEKVGEEVRLQQLFLQNDPDSMRCSFCGKLFHWQDLYSYGKKAWICHSCRAALRAKPPSQWRGKGSFGKRPGNVNSSDDGDSGSWHNMIRNIEGESSENSQ